MSLRCLAPIGSAGVVLLVFGSLTFSGCATTSVDKAATPTAEEAGDVASPVAGEDNTVAHAAGKDNAVTRSVAYDGMADWKKIEETWGIRFESLRLSAAGAIVDFRYRIMNPAKAQPIVDRRNKAHLVVQATGEKLAVPSDAKIGPLRATEKFGKPKLGKVYYILFAIPGRNVKPGEKVTVVIGDFKMENLVVQ